MNIVSHNLAGLQAHAEAAIKSEASIYAWQESDVNLELRADAKAQLKELGYGLQHGWFTATGTEGTRKSRVAIATEGKMHAYALTYSDQHIVELAESGRWIERLIPVEDGHTFIIIASLYGISGVSGDPALAKRNDKTNHQRDASGGAV